MKLPVMKLPLKSQCLLCAGLLSLTACANFEEYGAGTSENAEVAVLSQDTGSEPEAPTVRVTPRPKPRPVGFHPEKLMELEPEEVSDILGDPNSVQHQAPALIWSYLAESCSLDIVFYATVDGERFEALQYIVKNGVLKDGVRGAILSPQASDNVSCVSDVLAKNQIAPLTH